MGGRDSHGIGRGTFWGVRECAARCDGMCLHDDLELSRHGV